jgi:eukaryotic-like serine/threonine-protein kinase
MAKRREERPATMWEFLKDFRAMRVFKILPKPPSGEEKAPERKGFI